MTAKQRDAKIDWLAVLDDNKRLIAERDRLRAVNVELLAALKLSWPGLAAPGERTVLIREAREIARAAIAKAEQS